MTQSNKKIYEFGFDVFSQNGEDGINKYLLEYLNITSGVVLEIGAHDGFYASNTANIWSKNENFKAILIESTDKLASKNLMERFKNIYCIQALASSQNSLEKLIKLSLFNVTNENFVLASVDIDGDDLNVTRSLGIYKPIILIVESNGCIIERLNPEGATVRDLICLGNDFGYEFIGMSGYVKKHVGNVYFIRNDFKSQFPLTSLPWIERGVLTIGGNPL